MKYENDEIDILWRGVIAYLMILGGSEAALLSIEYSRVASIYNPMFVFFWKLRLALLVIGGLVIFSSIFLWLLRIYFAARATRQKSIEDLEKIKHEQILSIMRDSEDRLGKKIFDLENRISTLEKSNQNLKHRIQVLKQEQSATIDEVAKAALDDF